MNARIRLFALAALLPLATACVTKGTHNTTLGELSTARSSIEQLQTDLEQRDEVISGLRAELASARQTADARSEQITQLEAEVARLDQLQRQTRSEVLRLETTLGARGSEYRQLQQRLESLAAIEQEVRDRNRIYEEVLGRFQSLIDGGQLTVAIVRGRMVIQLPQDILFESGSAVIGRQGQETLASVGAVLADLDDRRFQIEGHTDDVPISTSRFPSNWELSSARALSVVRLLIAQEVVPANVSGAGYGEFQPVADNDTPDNRRLNRRIEIVMLPNLDVIAGAQVPN
jgi:chemotaxis protein MotB